MLIFYGQKLYPCIDFVILYYIVLYFRLSFSACDALLSSTVGGTVQSFAITVTAINRW